MLISSHGILGYLLYRKSSIRSAKIAALGAIMPDLIFAVALFIAFILLLISGELSFSFITVHDYIHEFKLLAFFETFSHSIFLWIPLFIYAYFKRKDLFIFAVGGVSHIITDLLTHQGDLIWYHLYPFSMIKIQGLVNYRTPEFLIFIHMLWIILLMPEIKSITKKIKKKLRS